MTHYPRISVIMPSFNQVAYLEEAVVSVIDQKYPNLEFMIVDGGSTDGSPDIIERYSRHLAYWYCQRDAGQSAAIDHGMSRATGELAGWLNSDDVLLPGALQAVAESYVRNPDAGLFGGNVAFIDSSGLVSGFLRMPSNAAQFARLGIFAVGQAGSFFSIKAYRKVGGIRHDLHYLMDNDLYLRIMLDPSPFAYIDRYLACFRRHAAQKTTALFDRAIVERLRLRNDLRPRGIVYRSAPALALYYLWQAMNGNYLKKRWHARNACGRHWREWWRDEFKN